MPPFPAAAALLLLLHLAAAGAAASEEFTEELLLRPLPDRKLLSHFHFQTTAPPSAATGRHHTVFPKAIAHLVWKFRIKEMELSFTQGRWNYESWGGSDPMSSTNVKPPGVELRAILDVPTNEVRKFHIKELELSFTQGRWNYESWGGSDPMSSTNVKPPGVELWAILDVPTNEIDSNWKNITHALSGLFSSSINFMESSTAYSAPRWGFRSNSSNLRYGALPREAVCTENLTPWLKLLPCRDKSGLASLLDRPSICKSYYLCQRLRLFSNKSTGIVLEQTLTVVVQPNVPRNSLVSKNGFLQPSWSFSSIFKTKVTGQCILSKASRIFFEIEEGLVAELDKLESGDYWSNSAFELSIAPHRVIRESNALKGQSGSILFEYGIVNFGNDDPLDMGITWKLPLVWSGSRALFHTSRFLMGSGNERGSIAISWQSTGSNNFLLDKSHGCTIQVVVFQVVPWYVKVYYHTLEFFLDGKPQNISDVLEKIHTSPSEDKMSPGTMEASLKFPCNTQSAVLTLDFDKGFLHIDEYPPDANQGFDIPSALVSFPSFHSSRHYVMGNSSNQSPLLDKFKEGDTVKSYTEVLLVPLTTPDFSMPYNVITFTCTVLALYFGSLLNVLRRRVGEEERLLKVKAKPGLIPLLLSRLSAKLKGQTTESPGPGSPPPSSSSSSILGHKVLFKVILVVVVAVTWNYYFNSS